MASESELLATLRAHPGLQGTGWEYLFDEHNRLIEARVDELRGTPTYVHPRREHYRSLARRLGLAEADFFVRTDTSMPACGDARVEAAFTAKGATAALPRFGVLGDRERYFLNPARVRVGLVTQGGITPGYNVVIDAIVKRHSLLSTLAAKEVPAHRDGTSADLEILGFQDGFPALGRLAPVPLQVRETDKSAREPGSLLRLGAEPLAPAREEFCWKAVARHELDILYVIGDRAAVKLADRACQALTKAAGRAGERIRIVAAPVSIEDDFAFTDSTVGYQTALADAVQFILRVHAEARACKQLAIVVLPGRDSGALTLSASHASGEVDYALLPETLAAAKASDGEELARAAELLVRRCYAKQHAVAVLSGASIPGEAEVTEAPGKESAVERFMQVLRDRLKHAPASPEGWSPRLVVRTAHTVGSGEVLPYDVNLGKVTGKLMVDAALSGLGRCVVSQWRGQFVAVPMGLAIGRPKTVDLGSYCPRTMSEKYLLTPIPAGSEARGSTVGEEFG